MIVFINNTLAPYHISRFNALRSELNEDILFVEVASKNGVYFWPAQSEQANAVCLFPDRLISTISAAEMAAAVRQILKTKKPDIVLTVSYSTAAMRQAAVWARLNGAISINVNESWRGDKNRRFFKEWIKRIWIRWAYDGMFVGGSRCRDYYQSLGFPAARFWLGQNCVDNDFFTNRAGEVRLNPAAFRAKYDLPLKFFLCPARLSPVKNLERLIKAFSTYRKNGGSWDLVITGSGNLGQELKSLTFRLNLEEHVHFSGWIQVEDMPVFYGLATAMVLPSISEPWGLVVNEAMASSLPVLVSDQCGCQPELCIRGVNGFDFNPFHEESIAEVLLKTSSPDADIVRMGQASLSLIQQHSPANYARSLSECIQTLRKLKRP